MRNNVFFFSRADFSIVKIESDKIFIVDLDCGNRSITNDAENVYADIKKIFPDHRLIYRDTMGRWDEIVQTPIDFPINIKNTPDDIEYGVAFQVYVGDVPSEDEMIHMPISAFINK